MAKPSSSKGPSQPPRSVADDDPVLDVDSLKKLGKYEIQKKIGAGGMGSVFLALDTGLRRAVALKVLPRDKANNPTLVKRFKSEAQSAANLRHDNIVMIYEAGEVDGFLYIALEYVDGTDVANIVSKRGVMPVKRSLDIVRQMGLALQHAHAQGIVHRDIKPANILIRRDGTAKLADLGLARAIDDHSDTSITRAGTTVGTVDYMSPEQARDSKAADVRSDFYSLGCTWYFMLTGEAPFPDGSMTNKLRSHAESPLPDPRSINPSVTEAIIAVIRRMTEKDRDRRYQTPDELLADLETARIASDIVSDAILGDSDDDRVPPTAKRKPARQRDDESDDDDDVAEERPRSRPAVSEDSPSSPGWKPPRQDRERKREPSELGRAIAFYSIVVLLGAGVLVGLGWLVQQFGAGVSGPDKQMTGNAFPFAGEAADPTAAASADPANPLQGTASSISGAASTVDDRVRSVTGTRNNSGQAIEGQASTTSIGSDGDQRAGRVIGGPETERGGTSIVGSSTTGSSGTNPQGAKSGSGSTEAPGAPGGKGQGPGRRSVSPAAAAAAEKRRATEDAMLPAWSVPAAAPHDLPKVTRLIVRRGVSENGRFPSLNAALEQVPADGAIIILEGRGPFPVSSVRVFGKKRIVIQAEDPLNSSELPLVVLLSGDGSQAAGVLEFADSAVEFRQIHFAYTAASSGATGDVALIHMQGGELSLRNCSMTAIGGDSQPLAAIRLSGPANRPQGNSAEPMRVVLDQSVLRGDNLTALSVETAELDLVVRRSVLWSGKAAAIRLTGAAGKSAGPRNLRFVSTTVCSGASAVRVSGESGQPASTGLEWINSLVAVPQGSTAAALCVLDGWSADQQQALGKTVTWKSVDTLYLGWKPLVRLEPDGVAVAVDIGDWLRAWKDKSAGSAGQFQEVAWPSDMVDDMVRAPQLDRLAPETIGTRFVKTSDGGWPGCAPDLLSVAGLAALDVPFANASRPQIPEGLLGGPTTAEVIRVDLTRDDLGKVLAERKPQHGAQIVASGFGARQSSPIVIQNAWVRLRFEQTDGAPLVLSPRSGESGRTGEGNSPGDGFIVVNNGGLEITGGALTMPAGERAQLPRWFIQVTDGDLAMRHCRIQGPLFASTRNKGLVQWLRTGGGTPPPRLFAGSVEGYLALENCCLFGSGTLIEADLPKRAMFFRNCLLVARDDLLSVNLRSGGSEIAGTIDIETTTLSAAGSFLKLAAAALEAPASAPLSIFADRCVFGPPLHSGTQKTEPTLLSYSGPLIGTRQLAWSENHCGYAPDITAFLREEAGPVQPQDFRSVWRNQWGAAQVVEPLTGPEGVVLAKELPQRTEDRAKLEPADFALYAASRAATWDGGQRPIGAPLAEVQFPPIRAASGSTTSKSKPAKPAKTPPARKIKPAF